MPIQSGTSLARRRLRRANDAGGAKRADSTSRGPCSWACSAHARTACAHGAGTAPCSWPGRANSAARSRNARQFAEAVDVRSRVLAAMKRAYGESNSSTASLAAMTTTSRLASAYPQQQRGLAPADELQVWVVAAWTRLHGKEHPCTLDAINNLANTYRINDKLAQADGVQVGLLDARLRVHGKEHRDTRIAAGNVALTAGA